MTPRLRFLNPIALVLDRLSEEDWDLDKEMTGWELGDSLVLLPSVLLVEEIWNNYLDERRCLPESLKTMSRFSFKDNAPRVLVVLGVLQRARTAIQG